MKEEIVNKICDWLRSVLIDDHIDCSRGINCLFPDIILCEKYFKVDDLINALKDYIYENN